MSRESSIYHVVRVVTNFTTTIIVSLVFIKANNVYLHSAGFSSNEFLKLRETFHVKICPKKMKLVHVPQHGMSKGMNIIKQFESIVREEEELRNRTIIKRANKWL